MGIRLRNVDNSEGRATALGCPIQWFYLDTDGISGNEQAIVADAAIGTADQSETDLTIAANPNVARCLDVAVSADANADMTAEVTIWGENFWNEYIKETVTNLTLAGGIQTTENAFKVVNKAIVKNISGATTTGTDNIRIGYGAPYSLPVKIGRKEDILFAATGLLAGAGTGANMVYLTYAASSPGATEYTLDIDNHTITFGDVADANEDMVVAVMSTYRDKNMLLDT